MNTPFLKIPQHSFTVNNSPTQDYVHPDDHTKPTYNTLYCPSKILHKHCFQFLVVLTITPREIENNAYAKFWRDNNEYYGVF